MVQKQLKYPVPVKAARVVHQGKTRNTYATKYANLRAVEASDRLSTHNVVHESEIAGKGEVLTALTIYWIINFLQKEGIPTHLIEFGKKIYDYLPGTRADYPSNFHYRTIIIKVLQMIPFEIIFRLFLDGSLYRDYYSKGLADPYGVNLPPGLPRMYRFEKLLFTPTDKSENDDPVRADLVERLHPKAVSLCRRVYEIGNNSLQEKGLVAVDSKFECGLDEDKQTVMGDEILTLDSSRFTPEGGIVLGQEPEWLDKEEARREAMRIWAGGKKKPLRFSSAFETKLSSKYRDIGAMVLGESLTSFQKNHLD